MALRFHRWNRRLVGLGTGLALCASIGCTGLKSEHQTPPGPAPLNKSMGSGNTVSAPVSPAFNNLANNGPGFINPQGASSQTAMSPPYNPSQAMPAMPQMGARPNLAPVPVQMPLNPLSNPASFGQQAPTPNNQMQPSGGVQSVYPVQPQAPPIYQQNQPANPGQQQVQPAAGGMQSAYPVHQQMQPPVGGIQPAHPVMPTAQSTTGNIQPAYPLHQDPSLLLPQGSLQQPQTQPQPALPTNGQSMPGIVAPAMSPAQQPVNNYQQSMTTPVNPMPPIPVQPQSSMAPSRTSTGMTTAATDPRTGAMLAPAPVMVPDPGTGPAVKSVAGNPIRGVTDPTYELKVEMVEPAPVTVPETTLR